MFFACAALLTIIIETGIFLTDKEFRCRNFLIASVLINLSTNLTLNLILCAFVPKISLVLYLEIVVWTVEFVQFGVLFVFSWKLLRYVCYANAASFFLSPLVW